jgi:membrane protease YdiL (CAAX protease family)
MQDRSRPLEPGRERPLVFFALVFALSLPFWLLGAVVDLQVLPGLPVSALMAFTPAIAALILVGREGGLPAGRALLARSFDLRRIEGLGWWAAALLIPPAVMVAQYLWMRATGVELPSADVPVWVPALMLVAFFVGGLGEELGWSAYATEPLARRHGALAAALLIGVVWYAWHVLPFIQGGRDLDWIAWKGLGMLATRVIMAWLYLGAGRSVFAVSLYHGMDNVSAFLFPAYGSHSDPHVYSVILVIVAVLVALAWRRPQGLPRPS